jgi:tetratricopeptide (TPR) repeat protein
VLYFKQGRHAEAETLYKRALAIREKALGPDHPYVATSLNNLAKLYWSQGRYADALPLAQRVIASGRAVPASVLPVLLGAEHNNLISAEAALDGSLNRSDLDWSCDGCPGALTSLTGELFPRPRYLPGEKENEHGPSRKRHEAN